MLCAQAVCSKGVLLFLCVPVAVWGLVVGAVGCRVCRCAPPPPPPASVHGRAGRPGVWLAWHGGLQAVKVTSFL